MAAEENLRPVAVIGAALDLGAGRRGVDMGPSAIRCEGLASRIEELGRDCVDLGNVQTAVAEAAPVGDERVRFLRLISESGLLDSLEVVEVSPILDRENQTAKLAVELVASALGARIL